MKVGLLGGSFDPVHNGHLKLASSALRQLKLSKVYFVLAPRSPFKKNKKRTPINLRLAMLRLALRGKKRLAVGPWEMRRPGPSYTVDTLRRYRKDHPGDEVHLLMGSDTWKDFPRWRRAKEIGRMSRLVVGRRPAVAGRRPRSRSRFDGAVVLRGAFPNISSTEIRRRIRAGRSARRLLPPAVEKYIRKRGLLGLV